MFHSSSDTRDMSSLLPAGIPIIKEPSGRLVPRAAIEQAVVQVFGVGYEELHGSTRGRARIAFARQVAMYLAHVACRLSFTDTGRLFGRDRTTVAHACSVVEDRRDDPVFDHALNLLEWAVHSFALRSADFRPLS
jgi:chromosomal replication initiation ATPase DnaA